MSLKNQLETIDGIFGLDTYAKSHSVTIYYDPKVISEKNIPKCKLSIPLLPPLLGLACYELVGFIDDIVIKWATVYCFHEALAQVVYDETTINVLRKQTKTKFRHPFIKLRLNVQFIRIFVAPKITCQLVPNNNPRVLSDHAF